jgi:dihydrofolate reductase
MSDLAVEAWMKSSVFVGVSVDGFLARKNHRWDFLQVGAEPPPGFEAFLASVDVLVMGRNTFEAVRGMEPWPYGQTPVVVLSSRELDFSDLKGVRIESMSATPKEVVAKLEARGAKHLYVDGGVTIQRFLSAGLINRLIVTRVPVLIGDGIPLFGPLPHDVKLMHVKTKEYPDGAVRSEYEVG